MTESSRILLGWGITQLADRISSFEERDWQQYNLGDLLTDALAACWKHKQNEVEKQSDLRKAFLQILTELCARQVPKALHLRNKVAEALGSQAQSSAPSRL